jgi:hypothetical protein
LHMYVLARLDFALLWFGTNSRNGACIEDSILYPWGNSKGQLAIGLHVERVLLWATGCALKWRVWIEEGSVLGVGRGGGGGGVILGIMEILKSRGLSSYCCLFCFEDFLGGCVWIYVVSSYSLIW